MDESNNVKMATAKAPQSQDVETSDIKSNVAFPLDRHLGLIKAMAIMMAVLIVAALVIIVVTIYSRLETMNIDKKIQESELKIPFGSQVSGASVTEKGQILLVLEDSIGQQLWQVDQFGEVQRKIRVIPSP